jgi:hypothetical protein
MSMSASQQEKELDKDSAGGSGGGDGAAVTTEATERVRLLGKKLPLDFVYRKLKERVEARLLTRDFICHIPFVVFFVLFAFGNRQFLEEHLFVDSVKKVLELRNLPPTNPVPGSAANDLPYFHKDWTGIGNEPDWYDWAEAIMAPALFSNANASREPKNNRLAGQSLLIGALRVRAKHVRAGSCVANPTWYPTNTTEYPQLCYAHYSEANQQTAPFNAGLNNLTWGYQGCDGAPLQDIYGQYKDYGCGGYTVDIPFNTTLDAALAQVATFREGAFARVISARLVVVEFFAYNAAISTFLSVKMQLEITEGGGFIPFTRVKPFVVFPATSSWIAISVVFLLLVVFYLYRYVQDWRTSAIQSGKRFAFLFNLWNMLQLLNLALFVAGFVYFFWWWYHSVREAALLPRDTQAYPSGLAGIAEIYTMQLYLNSVNTTITLLMLMKFLQLNHQLSILQRTLITAAPSISAVLIIFAIILMAYAFAGNLVYGSAVAAYRTITYAFVSNFRVLVGDFDYWALYWENRALTFVFFWSLVVLGLFVMLNFIVAVIMGAFSHENSQTKPKSIAQLVRESIDNQKRSSIRNFLTLITTALLNKKMPEDTLYEKMTGYMIALLAQRGHDVEDEDDLQENAQKTTFSDSEAFSRYDFLKVMPRAELEDFGDEYMDTMWFAMVDDFSNTLLDETDKRIEELSNQLYDSSRDACVAVFMTYKHKIFGKDDFLDQLATAAHYEGAESPAAQQTRALAHISANHYMLQTTGAPAENMHEIVAEVKARSVDIAAKLGGLQKLMVEIQNKRARLKEGAA